MRNKRAKQLRNIARKLTVGESEEKTRKIYKGLKQSYENRSPALITRLSECQKK